MEKVLLAVLALALVLGVILGGITLINERNHEKLLEYVDTFSAKNDNSDQLIPKLDEYGNWYFTTDEDFKILHLTDIHMTGGPIYFENDKRAINAVAAMINAEDPDLVIITGDISFAYITDLNYNNKRVHELFIRLMNNLDVYWTVTFGNHDSEPYNNYNREEVEALYVQAGSEKCLFTPSPEGVFGRGNHVINIKNTSGDITQSLFMFDSHSYIRQDLIGGIIDSIVWNYDNIKQDQVDILFHYHLQRFDTGIRLIKLKVRTAKIYFQCVDDILLVIANQNVIHKTPPLAFIISIFGLRRKW